MQLGIVLTGTGALAAAGVGVLKELCARGIDPAAVCGMQTGAWPAALYMAGRNMEETELALRQSALMGRRMLRPAAGAAALLHGRRAALADAKRLEHLLAAQTAKSLLCMCPRPGILLCRTASGGRKVIFSSYAYAQNEHAMLCMQASAGFAARAAMTLPPFLAPAQWMGSLLLAEHDEGFACAQLLAMGMHRVLVVRPVLSPRHEPDALDLTGMAAAGGGEPLPPGRSAVLQVDMPQDAGALSVERLEEIAEAGRLAAKRQLDQLLGKMGMSFCRVLPFRPAHRRADAQ
ncbi:MAG: hypothetical protein IJD60_07225 [Clostridia bacterium]|nr:hypothetical protein [Clostridia bacterium]